MNGKCCTRLVDDIAYPSCRLYWHKIGINYRLKVDICLRLVIWLLLWFGCNLTAYCCGHQQYKQASKESRLSEVNDAYKTMINALIVRLCVILLLEGVVCCCYFSFRFFVCYRRIVVLLLFLFVCLWWWWCSDRLHLQTETSAGREWRE